MYLAATFASRLDNAAVALGSIHQRIWQAQIHVRIPHDDDFAGRLRFAALTPDNRILIAESSREVVFCDVQSGAVLARYRFGPQMFQPCGLSKDGKWVIGGGFGVQPFSTEAALCGFSPDNRLLIGRWDVRRSTTDADPEVGFVLWDLAEIAGSAADSRDR